jgi:CubicO group peptidase (beta-lactamase class C family)
LSHVHGFAILRNGKIISEGYWKPYSKNQVHQLFSVSKSFTSSAIGFLADEGKIKLDEKVLNIFPEKAPSNPSPYLKSMKIRDLLTMTSGHNCDTIRKISVNSSDWIKSFFSLKMDHAPGSRFVYNTGATYILSAIAEKRSGMKLFDYLDGKLFAPLGITDAVTTTCPAGIACGGYGMSMTVRDLATFGQFLLQKGNWNGKQLLSKEWIESATSKQVDNSNLKTPDYTQGYGFQFWRCTHNAYRADGARGQFIIVIPEENMVVAMTSGLSNMQKPMDLVWKHILPANSKAPLPENKNAYQRLKEKCAALSMPVVTGEREGLSAAENQEYEYTKNEDNIKNFKLVTTKNGWEIVFANEAGSQRIPIGYGKWLSGNEKAAGKDAYR